jgi:hypothetical protein
MEVKICRACHKEKSLKSFYRNKQYADGYEPKCRICKVNKVRIRELKPKKSIYFQDWNHYFRLVHPNLEDYCMCYGFFSNIGYDPSKDIHTQFCEKYNLTPSVRKKKDENKYFYSDCD